MTPDEQEKLDETHDTVVEMRGMLTAVLDNIKDLRLRLGFVETRIAAHEERIIQQDRNYTGLATKLRRLDNDIRNVSLGKKPSIENAMADKLDWALRLKELWKEGKTVFIVFSILGLDIVIRVLNYGIELLHRIPRITIPHLGG